MVTIEMSKHFHFIYVVYSIRNMIKIFLSQFSLDFRICSFLLLRRRAPRSARPMLSRSVGSLGVGSGGGGLDLDAGVSALVGSTGGLNTVFVNLSIKKKGKKKFTERLASPPR